LVVHRRAFKTWGHPEVVVFGVDYETSHELLTTVARAAKAGHNVADGSYDDQVLDGFEVRFLPVRRHWYSGFFGYAQWFNETAEQLPFLQFGLAGQPEPVSVAACVLAEAGNPAASRPFALT